MVMITKNNKTAKQKETEKSFVFSYEK